MLSGRVSAVRTWRLASWCAVVILSVGCTTDGDNGSPTTSTPVDAAAARDTAALCTAYLPTISAFLKGQLRWYDEVPAELRELREEFPDADLPSMAEWDEPKPELPEQIASECEPFLDAQ